MKWLLPALACCTSGCFSAGYLTQAAAGQYELLHLARPVNQVVDDAREPEKVRTLLAQVGAIKDYGHRHGLTPTKNYARYSDLHRPAAVWVVQACAPLAFEVKRWSFPIVGSVPYLGYFAPKPAAALAAQLEKTGLDVSVRTASAYSTLGWFPDPVLSTMLGEGDGALSEFANTILHESVHATVYVDSQSSFDESLASFVADQLTLGYLREQRGLFSADATAWLDGQAAWKERSARLHQAYQALDALYRSPRSDDEKRAEKTRLLEALQRELRLKRPLNNASLAGYQSYQSGDRGFKTLFDACGGVPRMLEAVKTLTQADFGKPQQTELDPVLTALAKRACGDDIPKTSSP